MTNALPPSPTYQPASLLLTGHIVLLTGAAGHLGQAIAQQLAHAGATVLLNGRSEAPLKALADTITAAGHIAHPMPFDITNADAITAAMAQITNTYGQLDGLVNNAYAGPHGPNAALPHATADMFTQSLHINVTAPFLLTQQALPLLSQSAGRGTGGAIVNMGSMYGHVSPNPDLYGDSGLNNPPFYGAGKAGLAQLTRYIACHAASQGVRCNMISPGPFPPENLQDTQPAFAQRLANNVPLKRTGHPSDVAGAVQFLLSPAASYINGATLPVDGGWTAS